MVAGAGSCYRASVPDSAATAVGLGGLPLSAVRIVDRIRKTHPMSRTLVRPTTRAAVSIPTVQRRRHSMRSGIALQAGAPPATKTSVNDRLASIFLFWFSV